SYRSTESGDCRLVIVRLARDSLQEHAHFLLGLLVPPPRGDVDASAISFGGVPLAARIDENPAEQFPGGRIIGVLLDGNLRMLERAIEHAVRVVPCREREPRGGPVLAGRDHGLELLDHAHRLVLPTQPTSKSRSTSSICRRSAMNRMT